MIRFLLILLSVLSTSILATPAYAGLFDDDEARQAVIALRSKLDSVSDQLTAKADKTVILEQMNQLDSLRQEMAKLRGQVEVLANEVSDDQRRQKDFYADLDNRLRKLEPQKVMVDGEQAQVDPSEQKNYDTAIAVFQSGDYVGAANALTTFIRTYGRSAYIPNAKYSLGIAYYAQRNYKSAISAFQSLIKTYPDNPKAPDAMLTIASCYSEQKDKASAKKVLQNLRMQYPDSTAAKTALDRLKAY